MEEEVRILRLLKNNKFNGFYFFFMFILVFCSCNKTNKQEDMIIHNPNELSGHLEQIIECFVKEYKVKGKILCIFEGYPTIEHKHPDFITDINIDRYVYIVITVYDGVPKINENRVLYTTKLNDYTLYYVFGKDKIMGISNDLIWNKIETTDNNTNKFRGFIDYIETQFLYNKEENVIELSDFKSESCKGRLNDEYEW